MSKLCYKYHVMEDSTPMMKQYKAIKSQYPECVLLFRLGDFYEMFYEDAKKASAIMDVVLTSRAGGQAGKIPMCGIPYHAVDSYLARLIKAGLKVAICEQVEDPSKAKGLVKRDVVRVITSGTFIDENSVDSRYLFSLVINKKGVGLSFTDIRNGAIYASQYEKTDSVIDVIARFPAYECVFPEEEEEQIKELFQHPLLKLKNITLSPIEDWKFNTEIAKKSLCEHFQTNSLRGFGIEEMPLAIASSGALLEYLKKINRQPMLHIDKICRYGGSDSVFISSSACRGLELDGLVSVLDETFTPSGKRLLRYWIYHPLKKVKEILNRQRAVSLLKENTGVMANLERLLKNVPDIERSLSRISCGYGSVRDILAVKEVLGRIPALQDVLQEVSRKSELFVISDISELRQLLERAVNSDVSPSRWEGKIIKKGYSDSLDLLKDTRENARQWLKDFHRRQKDRTGINSLKVAYNKVFGYYIEVTNTKLDSVPPDYIRKQTLVNAERFITQELKEFEENMLTAEEKILRIEDGILKELKQQVLNDSSSIHKLSEQIARIDVLNSLTSCAVRFGYIAPEVHEGSEILIKQGRHPVVERMLQEEFVPNDILIDCEKNCLLIITGPNMAGKSTYIRQIALLVIMAQIGSFVSAGKARIGVVDKIFTRIGAQDEISKGQSTFMVEMSESADILNNLSERSLIVLDEIGRGTSTYDGLSLAWAMAEYLQKRKVRVLFATHFHELTSLAEDSPCVKNYNVAVKEWKKEIIFLHKIVPGGADESYGIYVAKLAGVPKEAIVRATQILLQLEAQGALQEKIRSRTGGDEPTLFSDNAGVVVREVHEEMEIAEKIREEIVSLDINSLSPLEGLNKIQEWKDKINGKS